MAQNWQNPLLMAGLNMAGAGLQGQWGVSNAAQGLAQGFQMNQMQAEEKRRQEAAARQKQQHAMFANMLNPVPGGGTFAPQNTPVGGPAVSTTPAPVPVSTQPLAPQGGPQVPSPASLRQRFGMGAGGAGANPTMASASPPARGPATGYGRQEQRLGSEYWREFGRRPPQASTSPSGGQAPQMAPTPAQALTMGSGGGPVTLAPVSGATPQTAAVQPAVGVSPGAGGGLQQLIAGMDPQTRQMVAMMGPEQGIPTLLRMMQERNKPGKERRIIKGADGFNYYTDTGERVIPGAKARDPKLLSPEAQAQALQRAQAGRSTTTIQNQLGGQKLTPAQEAVDKAYAKDYADFQLGGGYADAEKNLSQIEEAISMIEQEGDVTGTMAARLPDTFRAFVDPEGLQVQQMVEEVVQRNLREVLGAQFTEKEGERLISRAYDTRLSEEANLARLSRLAGAMREGLAARQSAATYLEENGTMRGYTGPKLPTARGLEDSLAEPKGDGVDFTAMNPQEVLDYDVSSLSEAEKDAYLEALNAIGN